MEDMQVDECLNYDERWRPCATIWYFFQGLVATLEEIRVDLEPEVEISEHNPKLFEVDDFK